MQNARKHSGYGLVRLVRPDRTFFQCPSDYLHRSGDGPVTKHRKHLLALWASIARSGRSGPGGSPIIKDEQVADITAVIQDWAGTVTDERKRQHVKNLRRNRRSVRAEAGAPACPRCGSTMLLRTSRRNGSQFWGCPGYPKCRGTRSAV